jgi:hypothetical protein
LYAFTTGTLLNSVFAGVPGEEDTLIEALHYKGGPTLDDKKNLLLKQGVAALLNAAHPDVDYPLDVRGVIDYVNAGLASMDQIEVLSRQMVLDGYNNLGCPLN